MKKVVSVVLVALMVLGLSVTAFAADEKFSVVANKTDLTTGDTVEFTVNGSEAAGKSATAGVTAVFDSSVFEVSNPGTWALSDYGEGLDSDNLAVFLNGSEVSLNGKLFAFELKVKATAPSGEHVVKVLVYTDTDKKVECSATVKVSGGATVVVTPSATSVKPEGVVTVTVKGDKVGNVSAAGVMITGISEGLTHDAGEWKLSGGMNEGFDADGLAYFMSSTPVSFDTDVFTFNVTVGKDCAAGEKKISLKVNADDTAYNVECAFTVVTDGEAHVHTWDEGKVTKEPTCTDKGVKTLTCACGATKTEDIAAKGHKEVVVDAVAATCTTDGLSAGTKCETCGAVLTAQKTVAATGHKYGEWKSADEAEHEHACSVCGASEKAAHAWDDGKVTKAATETETGEKVYTCKDCGHTKTEVLPILPPTGDNNAVIVIALSVVALVAVCGVAVVSKKTVFNA